jgi:hypothetical protein
MFHNCGGGGRGSGSSSGRGGGGGGGSGSGSGRLSFFFYQPMIWEIGVGQRRTGFMLSIQSKNQQKLVFSWLLPDVLTGWTLLLKPFFYKPKTWMMKLSRRF